MGSTTNSVRWSNNWEREEQRAVESAYDYNPDPVRGSLDDPMGPSVWDLR